MADWTKEKQEKVIKAVWERSQTDAQFRKELVSHPHRAIQDATGEIIPDSVRLQFIDKNAAHLTLVLPPLKAGEDELSEQQLESVAGGKGFNQTAFNESMQVLGGLGNVIGGTIGTAAHDAGF